MSNVRWIRRHRAESRCERSHEFDVLSDHLPEHLLDVDDGRVEVDDTGSHHLFSAEREELVCKGGRAFRSALDGLQVGSKALLVGARREAQLDVGEDRREHVVEVVRDPSRETPDRLHLLRLHELLGQSTRLGDVPDDDEVRRVRGLEAMRQQLDLHAPLRLRSMRPPAELDEVRCNRLE